MIGVYAFNGRTFLNAHGGQAKQMVPPLFGAETALCHKQMNFAQR